MSTRGLALSFALFVVCLAVSPAYSANEAPDLDAQKLIDACWAISQQDRDSGVTSRMRQGALNSVLCLEDVIADQAEAFKFPLDDVRANLEKIRFGVGRLYWDIYNGHPGCKPSCGTFFHVVHLPPIGDVLEEIIRTMISQRQQYGF